MKWYWIIFLSLLFGFKSVLERKYLKNSKQYIVTLIILMLGITVIYNIEWFIEL
ncbi:DUF4181 domain-containing protein [Halalkalibacter flavus]|uniref:DUF4181 domain-containing protein n=1 Tax=Halalkalibacter flavus TaxID=3090668 RepID=UPI003D67A303